MLSQSHDKHPGKWNKKTGTLLEINMADENRAKEIDAIAAVCLLLQPELTKK